MSQTPTTHALAWTALLANTPHSATPTPPSDAHARRALAALAQAPERLDAHQRAAALAALAFLESGLKLAQARNQARAWWVALFAQHGLAIFDALRAKGPRAARLRDHLTRAWRHRTHALALAASGPRAQAARDALWASLWRLLVRPLQRKAERTLDPVEAEAFASNAVNDAVLLTLQRLSEGALELRGPRLDPVLAFTLKAAQGRLRIALIKRQRQHKRQGAADALDRVAEHATHPDQDEPGAVLDARVWRAHTVGCLGHALERMRRSARRSRGARFLTQRLERGVTVEAIAKNERCSSSAAQKVCERALLWVMDEWLSDARCRDAVAQLGNGSVEAGSLGILLKLQRAGLRARSPKVIHRRLRSLDLGHSARQRITDVLQAWTRLETQRDCIRRRFDRALSRAMNRRITPARSILRVFLGDPRHTPGRNRRVFADVFAWLSDQNPNAARMREVLEALVAFGEALLRRVTPTIDAGASVCPVCVPSERPCPHVIAEVGLDGLKHQRAL